MQRPESTEGSSLLVGFVLAWFVCLFLFCFIFLQDNLCKGRNKTVPCLFGFGAPTPAFQAGREQRAREMARSPLSAFVGHSGAVTRARGLGQQMPLWIFPSCPGLCAWNLTTELAFAPRVLEVGSLLSPAEAKAGTQSDKSKALILPCL